MIVQSATQPPYPDPLGALVKRIREQELQLSQADLAWLAKVSRGTISNLETGRVTPDARTWHRIRTALALPPVIWARPVAGFAAQTMLTADAVQGIVGAVVALREYNPDAGRKAADRWCQLVVQLTGGNPPAGHALAGELNLIADEIVPLVPPARLPVIYDALRSWGWLPPAAQRQALVPRNQARAWTACLIKPLTC